MGDYPSSNCPVLMNCNISKSGQLFFIGHTMSKTQVKYPDIQVRLLGKDPNAFHIMGQVRTALKEGLRNTYPMNEIKQICDEYYKEATSGDYDNLLEVTRSYVTVV